VKKLLLLSLLAVGCAHAPAMEVVRSDVRTAADSVTVIREAVRAELLGVARPGGELSLFTLLNGEPEKIGVLTSSGTSVNNTTTAVTFTLSGSTLLIKCDTALANVGPGSTCSDDVTNVNHKVTLASVWEPYFLVRVDGTTTVCLDAPAATNINCAVFRMK
jgi:hypothetical protein